MSWDNRVFQINGVGNMLPAAIKLAFEQKGARAAVGWIVKNGALIIVSYPSDGVTLFPSPMVAEAIVPSINGWLTDEWLSSRAPNEPDHDGSNSKGWLMFVERWGHVSDVRGVIFAIKPKWLEHGK